MSKRPKRTRPKKKVEIFSFDYYKKPVEDTEDYPIHYDLLKNRFSRHQKRVMANASPNISLIPDHVDWYKNYTMVEKPSFLKLDAIAKDMDVKSDFVCYDINEIVGKAGSHKHKPDETDKA